MKGYVNQDGGSEKNFQKKNVHFKDEDVKNDSLCKRTKNPLAIGFKRQFLG